MIKQEENGTYRVTCINPLATTLVIVGVVPVAVGCLNIMDTIWFLNLFFVLIGVVFFVLGVWLLCQGRMLVAELSAEGVITHVSGVESGGLIRWEEIESVVKGRSREKTIGVYVGLTFVDLDAYLERLDSVQKKDVKSYVAMGVSPVFIKCCFLSDPDAFIELCNEFMKKASE